MISYRIEKLKNGLTFIHHKDLNTTLSVCNILYNVGSRDEKPEKTGFAHLFEHLMFGGSENIPSFDSPLQNACGENNAFTSNDITNYYITLPTVNIETALWLESDRMLRLDFSENSLKTQKGVVIEEFKQRYLNQPYGDAWLHLRPLAYKLHPYGWPTIGKEISHIQNAELKEVESFFNKFYNPSNASICIAGNIEFEQAFDLVKKWFEDIPSGEINLNKYPEEQTQLKRTEKIISADVPQNALYMAFHMVERRHPLYFAFDLLSDILSGTESSRFTNILVKEKELFTHVHAYVTGDIDKGLFVVEGRLVEGISFELAESMVLDILNQISKNGVSADELVKVKNKSITSNLFAKTSTLNKAMGLCYAHRLGEIELINTEIDELKRVNNYDIKSICNDFLLKDNHAVLKYEKLQ